MAEQVSAEQGSAPERLIQHAAPGEVFQVQNEAICFPEARLGNRTKHDLRFVLVLQSATACKRPSLKTILVAPRSASWLPGPFDLELLNETGFTKPRVSVYTSLVQPILKSDLTVHMGSVSSDGWAKAIR